MNRTCTPPNLLLCAASLILILLLAGCSIEMTISHPDCSGDGSPLIVAQSVPTASKVPCLDPLPHGWDISTVKITETGTVLTFDSDRAGSVAARLRFATSCDVGAAIPTPTDHRGTERFEDITQLAPEFVARRYYRFDGGCVWWEFEFDEGAPTALSIELGNALQLIDRDDLQQMLADTFLEEEL